MAEPLSLANGAKSLPFTGAGAPTGNFDGIILQDGSGANQLVVYVDDVILENNGPPPGPINVSINLAGTRRAIDPLSYGVNFGSNAQHADLRYPTRRWGGNRTSRSNWQFDVDNTANDYFFQNIAAGSGVDLPNDSSANQFVIDTKLQGGEAMLTIPTLGWVAKDSRAKLWSFSQLSYGAQTLDECRYYAPNPPPWCTADSGNGLCVNGAKGSFVNNWDFLLAGWGALLRCDSLVWRATPHSSRLASYPNPTAKSPSYFLTSPNCQNGKIVGNNPLDTGKPAPVSYAADWITHLRTRHGVAAAGGVKFFALDNEPMLWNSTHRDVHPAPATYDEVWTRGRDRALAIKAIEPNAKIFGPVSWGWCDFWTSASDAALGNCFDGLDYDGANARVIGDSVPATSSQPELIGAYAVDQVGGPLRVLLFNRNPSARSVDLALFGIGAQSYSAWRLAAGGYSQVANNTVIAGHSLSLAELPGFSSTLLVINRSAPANAIFANGFE